MPFAHLQAPLLIFLIKVLQRGNTHINTFAKKKERKKENDLLAILHLENCFMFAQ